jgi:uncharacterized protein (TIGR02996 family)
MPIAEPAELLEAIRADPDKPDPYLVYADWLQAQGDPRGELIVLQHGALAAKTPLERARLDAAAAELLQRHEEQLLGPELHAQRDLLELRWQLGFIQGAGVGNPLPEDWKRPVLTALEALLRSPAARLLRELRLGWLAPPGERWLVEYGPALALLRREPPRSLEELELGAHINAGLASSASLGNLRKLPTALPRLRRLRMTGGAPRLDAADLQELEQLQLQVRMSPAKLVELICAGRRARLARLCISFSLLKLPKQSPGAPLDLLLDGESLPALRELGLHELRPADALAGQLGESPLVRRLHRLDLSGSDLGDAGAAALARAWRGRRLAVLDVTRCRLGEAGRRELRRICKELVDASQRGAHDSGLEGSSPSRLQTLAVRLEQNGQRDDARRELLSALLLAHHEGDVGDEARIRHRLGELLRGMGRLREAKRVLQGALELGEPGKPALALLGSVLDDLGERREAQRIQSRLIKRRQGHLQNVESAVALGNKALDEIRAGRYSKGWEHCEEARGVFRRDGNAQLEGWIVCAMANVRQAESRYPEARSLYEEGLALVRKAGDRRREAETLGNLGTLHWMMGDYASAEKAYLESLELSRQAGNERNLAGVLANLGQSYSAQGRSTQAEPYLREAAALNQEMGWASGEGQARCLLGETLLACDRLEEAERELHRALELLRAAGNPTSEACTLHALGSLALDRGELEQAAEHYQAALVLHRRVRNRYSEAGTLQALAAALHLDACRCDELLEQSLAVHRETGHRRRVASCLASMGFHRHLRGELERADRYYRQALEELAAGGEQTMTDGRTCAWLGALCAETGWLDQAESFLGRARRTFEAEPDSQGEQQLACCAAFLEQARGRAPRPIEVSCYEARLLQERRLALRE